MRGLIAKLKWTIIFVYLLTIKPCYSQQFKWCEDGFTPNVRIYKNIDNSGIDLDISGIYPKKCFGNEHYISTGINNGGNFGVVHNYEFSFSEYVDVEFNIYDINLDTTRSFRYYDYLVFSPSPIFSNSSSIFIKGDTILPSNANLNSSGEIKVKFKNINKFSIQHGLGKAYGYNPGFIIISQLIINDDKLGEPKILNKVAVEELKVFKQNTAVRNAHFITSTGQLLSAKYKTEETGLTIIETSSLASGIYFFYVEFDTGHILKEKIIIVH